jgi:hypothetical protein
MELSFIGRLIIINDVEIYLLMNFVDPSYGIKLVTNKYFCWNENKIINAENLMKEIAIQVQRYWNEGNGKYNEEMNRPIMEVELRLDGWTQCPFCKINFATYNKTSYQNNKHLTCGTKLKLNTED